VGVKVSLSGLAILHVIAYLTAMRLVLDTTTMVAGLRSDRGASRQLQLLALERRYTLLLSVPLVIEYEAVLTRPEHLEAARITADEVTQLLDALVAVADPVRLSFLWRPRLPDPDDDMVLEAAVNGSADLLVTINQRDFSPVSNDFRLRIVTPGEALRMVRGVQ
jgi:putative PIN family toxin of toxin-antitoxin system